MTVRVPFAKAARIAIVAALCLAWGPPTENVIPVFSIAKSQNRNQVQYVVRVDDDCVPLAPAPLSAYWRLLEEGATATAPLLAREAPAYGLATQAVLASDGKGGKVRAELRALPSRPLIVETSRGRDGKCLALTTTLIAGKPAHLFNVYVRLKWDGVDHLLLRGWSMDGSHIVQEELKR